MSSSSLALHARRVIPATCVALLPACATDSLQRPETDHATLAHAACMAEMWGSAGRVAACQFYVEQFPNAPRNLREPAASSLQFAGSKLARALRAPPPGEKSAWRVSAADLARPLTETFVSTAGTHKIAITRRASHQHEAALLRTAEAVYAVTTPGYVMSSRPPCGCDETAANTTSPTGIGEPVCAWSVSNGDDLPRALLPTTSAIRYFLDASATLAQNPRALSRFTYASTELNYFAAIRYHARYQRGKDAYEDVYVADMHLGWVQRCGSMCGSAYWKNKVVVLSRAGEVEALYLDHPINGLSTSY